MKPQHLEILNELILMEKRGTLKGCFDIPNEVYQSPKCPAIRSGAIKEVISRSYSHYAASTSVKKTKALQFGSQFHQFMEGDPTGIGNEDLLSMTLMKQKIDRHPEVQKLLEGDSKTELTFFSIDQETGLTKRCRADKFNQNSEKAWILDWKTTENAAPEPFARDCRKYMYRIAAAYYLEIISEVLGFYVRDFYFCATEKEDPHECALYRADDRSIAKGEEEVRKGLRIFQNVYQNKSAWRGYETKISDLLI